MFSRQLPSLVLKYEPQNHYLAPKLLIYYNGKIIENHLISNKKFNIKDAHKLYYEKDTQVETDILDNSEQAILKELENIAYDND